jgi:hypothetical protein
VRLIGYPVAVFSHPVLTLQVHPGDRLTLDARGGGRARVRVVDDSDRLAAPREGEEIELAGSSRTVTIR